MFLNELQPLAQELIQQPVAFLGGFLSGALGLKLSDDPLRSWLQKQGINSDSEFSSSSSGNGSGPQSITIE
jgi:hypothetical protein